jgi:hypothetical protein
MTFPQQPPWPQQGAPQGFPQQPATQQYTPPPQQPQHGYQGIPQTNWPAQPQQPAEQQQQWQAQQPAEQQGDGDTSAFFGGGTFISFKDAMWRGVPRGGLVQGKVIRNQTEPSGKVRTWDDGSPRKELVLTLQTSERNDPEDDGVRQLPINSDKVRALREALKAAGAKDVAIGSWVYVAWTGDKPTTKGQPQKLFNALYAPPGQPDPMGGRAPQPAAAPPPPMPQQYAAPDPNVAAAQQQAWQAAQQPQQPAAPQGFPAQQPAAQAPSQPPGFNPFGGQQPGAQQQAQPQQQPAQFNPFPQQG